MAAEALFDAIDRFWFGLNSFFGQDAAAYIKLETADAVLPNALVSADGSLVTVLEVVGARERVDSAGHANIISELTRELTTRMDRPGHGLQVVFEYDPTTAAQDVHKRLGASANTARALGLSVDGLLADWRDAVARYTASEQVYLAVWTTPLVLAKTELTEARKEQREQARALPGGAGEQNVAATVAALRDRHRGFVTGLIDSLTNSGLLVETFDAHRAVALVRRSIDPEWTDRAWRPWLPGDPLPLRQPNPGAERAAAHFLYPSLASQVLPRPPQRRDSRTEIVGDRIHSPLMMTLMPQDVLAFADLFARLVQSPFPFRISMWIEGNGMSGLGLRPALASMLQFASANNKRFRRAVEELETLQLEGTSIVRLQICADTWVPVDEPKAIERLRIQASQLASALQSWGAAECSDAIGDPLLGMLATIPAVMRRNPAPAACAPLPQAVKMLPLTRPASVWNLGSLPLRSPDGKLLPFSPGTSLQAAWISLTVAPMGGGKSVFGNTQGLAFLLQPGLSELPYLTVIDIGPSSKGLVDLLKSALPPAQQHLATFQRLRMQPEYAVNPCDTPLGAHRPFPSHKAFLLNLLTLLATPMSAHAAPDGVTGLANACIDRAYDDLGPTRHPRQFEPSADRLVQAAVADLALPPSPSWWDVADALFDAGRTHEATRAQRFAMPVLAEIAGHALSDEIASLYGDKVFEGEPLNRYFWRSIVEACALYPIIAAPTRFDLGEVRVLVLDLDEVAPKGGEAADRQTAIMYMLARHIGAAHFFLQTADAALVDSRYREYQTKRIEAIRALPKDLRYDEFHRVASRPGVAAQIVAEVETAVRESRKWNLFIDLISQDLKDFPDILIDLATCVYVLGAGSHDVAKRIADRLGLPASAAEAIRNLRPPGRQGSSLLAIWNTSKGRLVHRLMSTLGPQIRWALDSTAENVTVRTKLYAQAEPEAVRQFLGRRYPDGLKAEVERRRFAAAERGGEDAAQNVEEELVAQILTEMHTERPV